jgi:hypothetical protein
MTGILLSEWVREGAAVPHPVYASDIEKKRKICPNRKKKY